jgi:phosphate transport system protein
MTTHIQRDLDRLQRDLLALAGLVEEMIDKAQRTFLERNLNLASEVIGLEDEVDRREVLIEEECLKLLALHQPVARDLRRIATVFKVNNELERMADLAVNVVEHARAILDEPQFAAPPQLAPMMTKTAEMVREALRAFVSQDAEAARDVRRRDDEVDSGLRELLEEIEAAAPERLTCIGATLHCISMARDVERIADHARNIAKDVIYLTEGTIVRHKKDDGAA